MRNVLIRRGVALTGVLLWLACLIVPSRMLRASGWKVEQPPDVVKVSCGKRNPIFYVGERVRFALSPCSAARYEVRNYYGDIVDKGPAGPEIVLKVREPGWYKLYLFGARNRDPWGFSVGGTMFAVFRKDPNFPSLPPADEPGGDYSGDIPTRSILAMGPERHSVPDAAKPDEAISKLQTHIALERKYYLPYDPVRKRALLVAFPNGATDLAGVRKIVEHFKDKVECWEPRNEPNYKMSGSEFVEKEMKPFYETVKSVSPNLKVLGPGTVTIGPYCLPWIEDFLKAGGAKYIDCFSFHAYNNLNGDLWLARKSLDELNKLLAKYGADKLRKWQTEQGYLAAVYGSYQPRLQGRWTMLRTMVFEQYGIPKEHDHYWYDRSHGFWDAPTWWENEDNGLNPAAVLLRVWSEEVFGTKFVKALDFGPTGNNIYIGSLFRGPGRSVVALMSAGCPNGKVELSVRGGGQSLKMVSPFGVTSRVPVRKSRAAVPISELPTYIELIKGQSVEVTPINWGTNIAGKPGVNVTHSTASKDSAAKIVNGDLENWYYAQGNSPGPWTSGENTVLPAWVQIKLPQPRTISRVIVFASPPWQSQSTLVDYELQYLKDGRWLRLEHVQEPTKTFRCYTPAVRCTVDSFFSDRWVFTHAFRPIKTDAIRLLINKVTWGGGATKDVIDAGGQASDSHITLREVEIYNTGE